MSTGFFDFHEKVTARATPAPAQRDPAAAMTVSQITAKIEGAIKSGVPASVLVRGEVTNFSRHRSSGHLYFTLKDPGACISCVMFKGQAEKLKFDPADGQELLAGGAVRVYKERGQYQLYVESLQPLGAGALELAFQQLKAKLEKEGLFAVERKRRIPKYPMKLVLVTSRQTAALQDMLKVLRNYKWVKLYVYHVPVQGGQSAPAIAAGLEHLNRTLHTLGGADAILLGRGGGSLEDLWAFNEEAVARAVASMKVPVITGIGHEVDVSICDLIADYHAHTPTEAAQVAMANWRAVTERLHTGTGRLARAMAGTVGTLRHRLGAIERHELFRRPLDRIARLQQRLDDRERALGNSVQMRLRNFRRRLDGLTQRLERHRPSALLARWRAELQRRETAMRLGQQRRIKALSVRLSRGESLLARAHPAALIKLQRTRLQNALQRLNRDMTTDLQRRRHLLESLEKHLRAVGPERVLERGYSITLTEDGQVVRSKTDVKSGDVLVTRLKDGEVRSSVDGKKQAGLFDA
jgi:exodeoxyribonuclease VII large subunit